MYGVQKSMNGNDTVAIASHSAALRPSYSAKTEGNEILRAKYLCHNSNCFGNEKSELLDTVI